MLAIEQKIRDVTSTAALWHTMERLHGLDVSFHTHERHDRQDHDDGYCETSALFVQKHG
jgi:hypothetical protein